MRRRRPRSVPEAHISTTERVRVLRGKIATSRSRGVAAAPVCRLHGRVPRGETRFLGRAPLRAVWKFRLGGPAPRGKRSRGPRRVVDGLVPHGRRPLVREHGEGRRVERRPSDLRRPRSGGPESRASPHFRTDVHITRARDNASRDLVFPPGARDHSGAFFGAPPPDRVRPGPAVARHRPGPRARRDRRRPGVEARIGRAVVL